MSDGPTLFGPDNQPLVHLTGANPSDYHKQKRWKIGDIESPPLPGTPDEIIESVKQAGQVVYAANMVTPLSILCFQATSILGRTIERRLGKLEDETGPVASKKRLTKRLADYEKRIMDLEGRVRGLIGLMNDIMKKRGSDAPAETSSGP